MSQFPVVIETFRVIRIFFRILKRYDQVMKIQSRILIGRIPDIIRFQAIVWSIIFGFILTFNNFYLLFFFVGSHWWATLTLVLVGTVLGLLAYLLSRKSVVPTTLWEVYLQIAAFSLVLGLTFGFEKIEKKATLADLGPVVYGVPGIFEKGPNDPPYPFLIEPTRISVKVKNGPGLIGAPVDSRYVQYSRAFVTSEVLKLNKSEIEENFYGEVKNCLLNSSKQN